MKNNFLRVTSRLLVLGMLVSATGCAAIFIPKKQNVTINTDNDEAVVYVDKEEVGEGTNFTFKTDKDGIKNVVIQTPGYMDQHHVIVPGKVVPAVYPLFVLDAVALFYPLVVDGMFYEKFRKYDKVQNFSIAYPERKRAENERYIRLTNISMEIEDKKEGFKTIYAKHNADMDMMIEEADSDQERIAAEIKAKEAKKKKKNGDVNTLDEDQSLNFDDTKFSNDVRKTLYETGYVDTINKVFQDEFNTILLEGKISEFRLYRVAATKAVSYHKMGVKTTWYVKNAYNEILDSTERMDYSGEYGGIMWGDEGIWIDMIQEAMNFSYSNLMEEDMMAKYINKRDDSNIPSSPLAIANPANLVKDVKESADASVIVKRTDGGHGSGFAISNDGYILTNYHVISGDYDGKLAEIKVVLSDGQELDVEVVRYNKRRDIALLKVDHTFAKAFLLEEEKKFSNLLDVYTIGAPKSIELGQSVTIGLISNERNSQGNKLVQLNMAVNPGNSGGPLFEKSGTLHGVIKSKLVGIDTEGVSFAIPSYMIKEYLNIDYK